MSEFQLSPRRSISLVCGELAALRSVLSELREDRSSVAVATKCCSLLNSYRNLYSLANADRSEEPARRDGRPGETLPLPCVRIAIPLWHPV